MNGQVLVCFAMPEEAGVFKKWARGQSSVQVLLTGMGVVNAERAVRRALASIRPKAVLSCGFAGGLRPGLVRGTVVFEAVGLTALEQSLQLVGAQPARFHCASRIALKAAEKRALWESTGADAVEMESRAICEVCREQAIACGIVRVISDTAEEDLPLDFNQLMTPSHDMDFRKLAKSILKSPRSIGGLLRLQRECKAAARRLAAVLEAVLAQRPGSFLSGS